VEGPDAAREVRADDVCVFSCETMDCGEHGCGSSCGGCATGFTCEEGKCKAIVCTPGEAEGVCLGPVSYSVCSASGTGYEAAYCGPSETCFEGQCAMWGCELGKRICKGMTEVQEMVLSEDGSCAWEVVEVCSAGFCKDGECVCVPACEDKECGPDGCGGSCGECEGPKMQCVEGECQVVCDCQTDADCAAVEEPDLCNGMLVCGLTTPCKCEFDPESVVNCPVGQVCVPSTGECCVPDCSCKKCGGDGCGGSCGDCKDGKDCTVDSCQDGKCVHVAANTPGCCETTADCDDGDPCTEHFCLAHECLTNVLEGCCSEDADCNAASPCVKSWCDPIVHFCDSEAKGLEQQKAEGLECCKMHGDCGSGGIWEEDTDGDGIPGPDNAATKDYCVDGLCKHATYPGDCDCGQGKLCQDDNPCTSDECKGGCVCVHEPLPECCLSDSDCSDLSACTDDVCDAGNHYCKFLPKMCCCLNNSGCFDDNPCTMDLCLFDFGMDCCHHEPIADCCLFDSECDDCDPCTADKCIVHKCMNLPGGCQEE